MSAASPSFSHTISSRNSGVSCSCGYDTFSLLVTSSANQEYGAHFCPSCSTVTVSAPSSQKTAVQQYILSKKSDMVNASHIAASSSNSASFASSSRVTTTFGGYGQ